MKRRWVIRFAGQARKISGTEVKKAIKESFKKKPPKFLGRLIEITDRDTGLVMYLSTDSVVGVR